MDMDSRVCMVGANGAGKSTLLKLIAGQLEASQGVIQRNAKAHLTLPPSTFLDSLFPQAQLR